MSRVERKALERETRKRAAGWPSHLVEVPESEWPPWRFADRERPTRLWRSRHYLAQLYTEPAYRGVEVRRLSVNRCVLVAGGWEQGISWDDLQRCKRETGFGDWYGFEIYPRDRDVVNLANMRHIWLLAEPLPIGWF